MCKETDDNAQQKECKFSEEDSLKNKKPIDQMSLRSREEKTQLSKKKKKSLKTCSRNQTE
jgi:hypothetical protein